MIVKAHTSMIGETGYNCHSRNFFKELDKLIPVQVRNCTIGSSWQGYNNDEPHNGEYYMDDQLKKMLVDQTLNTPNGRKEYPLYVSHENTGIPDVHIVLNETDHYYFYDNYDGIKIAYNVWETTRQPEHFFQQLKSFDQVWVPTEWQRQCTIEQGIPAEKVKVVPEGVDIEMYKPINRVVSRPIDRSFRFLLVGRWDYRKSTFEIIKTFTKTFSEDENVDLIISVDNPFATDGMNSTEERLEKFGIKHSGIKVVHHLSKDEYAEMIKTADIFLSCARSEGWNLPLIEAMSSGIPSIYSEWGGQLEFASGKGIPVKVKGEVPAGISNNQSWNENAPGNFAEPDFEDLAIKMRDVVNNYIIYKKNALDESDEIRNKFTWKNAAAIAKETIDSLMNNLHENRYDSDFAFVTCGNEKYMPLIEKMVKSINEFSSKKVLVYGIDCDVPFDYPNLIKRRLDIPYYSEHDRWYWKQYACIESLNENFKNYIWIDGDVVVNYNIDSLSKYFHEITNYPISDVHVQSEFFGWYEDDDGSNKTQLFNELLSNKYNVTKQKPIAHICLYLYNHRCKWWFEQILEIYRETPLKDYKKLLQWNDEGIDNLLRCIHKCDKYLPLSNFDVDFRGNDFDSIKYFLDFWNEEGPKNFGRIYGWQFIPKDKSNIVYFHGNKNTEFADTMIEFILMQKNKSFYDSGWFYTPDGLIKNLGKIKGVEGSTLDVAYTYGWDYAIYHEIYNLKDYERHGNVGIKNGDVVVDLGGNIGIFTRWAHQHGASKVITFEPDKRYFKILKKNSPKGKNSILFNAAIGDYIGKMRLTESDHLGGSNLWTSTNHMSNQYDVQVYTLDYLFKTGLVDRIDFLKVDIEGSEIIALNGISDENLSKVRNIVVEYHHEHLQFNNEIRDRFIDRLLSNGFNSYVLFCGSNEALQLIYFWR